jgi:hypothetical protein
VNRKLNKAIRYILDRLGEPSTWQGVGFIIGLCGGKFSAGLDWGQAAGLGGTVSALIKMLIPDTTE